MARRRTLNHKELRADYAAAERRKQEGEEGEGEGGDEDEEAPAKKPKKKAAPKEPKPKRVRTPKVVRQKVVWAVFNNSNQRIATYEYPKEKEARDHAARLQ